MNELATQTSIEDKIFNIRSMQVIIDRDLAELYGVETKVLNQAVKRNIERFPSEFRFQLNEKEILELVTNCDRFQSLKHSSSLPFAFTEQGVSMLSAVLKSQTAIKTSIQIINSFVKMRQFLSQNADMFKRLELVEKRQISHEIKTDEKFEKLFDALEDKSIRLIDNYCDDTTLTHLSKADPKVKITILTKTISKQLKLDIEKYNAQYKNLEAKEFNSSHDRFLILDEKEIYHIGASLKDLGKKWFVFSLLEVESFGLMGRVREMVGDDRKSGLIR